MLTASLVFASIFTPLFTTNRSRAESSLSNHKTSTVEAVNRQSKNRLATASPNPTTRARITESLAHLPLNFEENEGQANAQTKFISRSGGGAIYLASSGAFISLQGKAAGRFHSEENSHHDRQRNAASSQKNLHLKLIGASDSARVRGVDELQGNINYIRGNDPAKWRTNIPTYAGVEYEEVYRGVNLIFYGNQRQLEYDFVVAPGVNPNIIKLRFYGSTARASIDVNGDLILRAGQTEVRQRKPVIYQDRNGVRKVVAGGYVINGRNEISFKVGDYDASLPLVIDPVLVFSTYLGGSGDDTGNSIAVDSSGNVYVTGTTLSSNFPTQNPKQSSYAGNSDTFIAKLNAAGTALIYSTYIGGSLQDTGDCIAVDSVGNAYVAGKSVSGDFPTTPGALAPTYRGGDFDGFVLKLNAQGNALIYSTYLGGSANDSAVGLATDASGNAYVTGGTKSPDFPATPTAYLSSSSGNTDAYLTKLNSTGSALIYSTYFGGSDTDRGSSVAVDSVGNAYITGFTASLDFPLENAFQSNTGGSFDAFVAKINPAASGAASLIYSSYLGGGADDRGFGLALDLSGNAYVTGQTASNNFPVLNPQQATFGGLFDAFYAEISPAGAKLNASYLGGSGDDRATAIALNSSGNVYLTGYTTSTNFPVSNATQPAKAGGADAFVTKFNSAGGAILYSTYLGGAANENLQTNVTYSGGIALDSSSNAYVTGYTASTNFPTQTPLQSANAGGTSDAFITKISEAVASPDFTVSVAPASQTVAPGAGTSYTVTITPGGGFTGNVALGLSNLPNSSSANFNPASVSITDSSAKTSTLTITTTTSTAPGTYQLNVNATSGALQHSASTLLVVQGATSVDIVLSKTGSPNPAQVNSNLTYRIVATNNGPSPATGVTITDTLPIGPAFVSSATTQGNCIVTSTVTCSVGNLAVGDSTIVTIVVTPQSTGQLNNTATVTQSEADFNTANNSQTISTTVEVQANGPSMLDPNLTVRTVVGNLDAPTSMAFIGTSDFLVLEKNTGKVKRIVNGQLQSTVLDLAVNNASERGLLGIALHPNFPYKSYVYLYWTESTTGADSSNLDEVPLLGNRVDRYVWNGSTLTFDRNLIHLRAFQADANQPLRGNHNGGVIRFGPDGKLYIIIGDNGRRGFLQNVTSGGTVPDDQFGGPEPDNAHMTGVILRLNDDGTTPTDNPFFNANAGLTGEAAANVKKLFAYGIRNSFGMAFDPVSGKLWTEENGDDCCDEINRVPAGFNGGWVQIIGPSSRISEYKSIETTYGARNLQQIRWSPTLIADTPQQALSRLYMLPGAQYVEPEFSWKYAVAPSPIGFMRGKALGAEYDGDLFVGASRTFLSGGYLFRFKLTSDRLHISTSDSRLADRVADNLDKFDITESESLLVGRDFGITTDIETAPNGNLFVVSNTNNAVYEISAKAPTIFTAALNGAQETPPTGATATGTATLLLSPDETTAKISLSFTTLSSAETAAHIHGPAAQGASANVLFPLPLGQFSDYQISLTPDQVQDLKNGLFYVNVHTANFPNGEIRGQFGSSPSASTVQFSASNYSVNESGGNALIVVTRFGDTSTAATVDFTTSNGTASDRSDYTFNAGTLRFAPGETSKAFLVSVTDDLYVEGNEALNIVLSNPTGGIFMASPATATLTILDNDTAQPTTNSIDDAGVFVRQHYLDFLNREPDEGGLAYWTARINECGSDQSCMVRRRSEVSAAFFIEQEFQQTGFFIYRLYKASYGRQPLFQEFINDRTRIVVGADLDATKTLFAENFVQRPEFISNYPLALQGASFVDALIAKVKSSSNVDLTSHRSELISEYNAGTSQTQSRARVVRKLIEYPEYVQAETNPAFVLSQYFLYLRRDADVGGYQFWLNVLNNKVPGNYLAMVCAFLTSAEYQQRFSPVVTRKNSDCAGI